MKLIFPELENPKIAEALKACPDIEPVKAENLEDACLKLKASAGESIIAGIDFSSRDVLLSFKNFLPLKSRYFSSSFVCKKDDKVFLLADGGVNKNPTKEQFFELIKDSAQTAEIFLEETPKIALLSYSTFGSGGKNPDLEKFAFVKDKIRTEFPEYIIDGEMQLDVAVNPEIAKKKCPNSLIQGDANVLIVPDLNSGNIFYKSLEQLGGWTIAGPLIQGFYVPLGDLSRGSSVEDIKLTIQVIQKLLASSNNSSAQNPERPQQRISQSLRSQK